MTRRFFSSYLMVKKSAKLKNYSVQLSRLPLIFTSPLIPHAFVLDTLYNVHWCSQICQMFSIYYLEPCPRHIYTHGEHSKLLQLRDPQKWKERKHIAPCPRLGEWAMGKRNGNFNGPIFLHVARVHAYNLEIPPLYLQQT